MKQFILLCLVTIFIINSSVFAFTKTDIFDENLYLSFKHESILLGEDKIEIVRDLSKEAVSYNCSSKKAKGLNRLHLAAIDIAAMLGLDTKIDESLVPRIEEALKSISCDSIDRHSVKVSGS